MTDPTPKPEPRVSELVKRIAGAISEQYGTKPVEEIISTAGLAKLEAEHAAYRATLHGIAKYAECDHRHHAEPCAACDAAAAIKGEEVPPGYYQDQNADLEARLEAAERERDGLMRAVSRFIGSDEDGQEMYNELFEVWTRLATEGE